MNERGVRTCRKKNYGSVSDKKNVAKERGRFINTAVPRFDGNSQAARHLYPALTVKVFFSLDFIYLVSLDRISGGYQEDILEQFEKSKMAAKMDAIVKKTLNH